MENQDQRLVVRLAELLSEKGVSSEKINNALALMCEGFSFDYGLVYEINQQKMFNLKESWNESTATVATELLLDDLAPKCREKMVEQGIVHLDKEQVDGQFMCDLSTFFSMDSGVILSISEKEGTINGLLVFGNVVERTPVISDDRKGMLTTALSILASYVDTRILENKLGFARISLESVLDNTGIDIYVNDFNTHEILYVNESMAAPYGGKENFMGKECWKALYEGQTGPCDFCPQKKLIDEEGKPTKTYTWDYERAMDGSWFRVFSSAFRWVDGRLAHVVSSADITDNKKNEATIRYMANFDSLTNLPNRRKLVEDFERRIEEATENDKAFVLFFDIDGFKNINDTYGHDAGDEFLINLGKFFSELPMLAGSIYRNGGDEFVGIISGEHATEEKVRELVDTIHQRFQQCWPLAKGDVFCGISAGVSCYPVDGTAAEPLLQNADQAMYKAKKSGGGAICFAYEL
ncbi:diguanylate cyclase (GGDEF)-like protein [Clostridiales Family XIII bacterium PM5-7]